ncbi:unnamed protein product [Soboliphyme baturini]|uniref:WAP domain-containing protein n=1 Tax=Soboliphyme baturini TaxID=241478 RepID=A0A183J1J3_9BILA|nr:unnamed protein product [Soboliphyme baturini]
MTCHPITLAVIFILLPFVPITGVLQDVESELQLLDKNLLDGCPFIPHAVYDKWPHGDECTASGKNMECGANKTCCETPVGYKCMYREGVRKPYCPLTVLFKSVSNETIALDECIVDYECSKFQICCHYRVVSICVSNYATSADVCPRGFNWTGLCQHTNECDSGSIETHCLNGHCCTK